MKYTQVTHLLWKKTNKYEFRKIRYNIEFGPGPVDLYRQFIHWLLSRHFRIRTYDIMLPAPDLGITDRWRKYAPVQEECIRRRHIFIRDYNNFK